VIEEHASSRKERHAARCSFEEARAELVFERADRSAERRLAHVKAHRSATHVTFFCDGDEITDLLEAHAPIVRDPNGIGSRLAIDRTMAHMNIDAMRRAGAAAAATLAHVGGRIAPGVTGADIDAWVREHTRSLGGTPSQLGFHGFPASVCVSKNHVVCHGIPTRAVVLEHGDIVNVDVTTCLEGHHGDTSATFVVGDASADARRLVRVARAARDAGIAVVREGARMGDIGAAITEVARAAGFSVVREYGGHGIGRKMHLPPHVAHVGVCGAGPKLRAGMAITIEPMINMGRADVRLLADGWTVVTADGSLSAQFEHTIVVTADGCEIMTLSPEEAARCTPSSAPARGHPTTRP